MNDLDAELVEAAEGIFGTWSGVEAIARCEWNPVVELDDSVALRTLGSLFRAHGRTLAVTPALGVLSAAAIDGRSSTLDDGFRTTAFNAGRDGDRVRFVCLGGMVGDRIIVDLDDEGTWTAECASAVAEPSHALEPDFAQTMTIEAAALEPLALDDGHAARRRAQTLVRIAIAHEMLGVCDALLGLATTYAAARSQFGQPIGSFQAVQHLLADAAIDASGLEDACRLGVDDPPLGDDHGTMSLYLKALAGRSSRRVLQATLQTLGAIGFTWEHDHHRFTRRVLTLDAVGTTTEELSRRRPARSGERGLAPGDIVLKEM